MEHSLKNSVKKSLQELSKVINGDSKTDPVVIFTVQIQLLEDHCMYLPSMIQLTQNVNILAKDVIDAISTVGRIRSQVYGPSHTAPVVEEATVVATTTDAGEPTAAPAAAAAPAPEDKHKKTYYEIISDDSDILRIVVQVMNGMSSTAIELQKYLSYWDKYKVRLYTQINYYYQYIHSY